MFLRHIQFHSRLIGIRTDTDSAPQETTPEPIEMPAEGEEVESQNEQEERPLAAVVQQTTSALEAIQRSLRTIEDHQRATHSELARATVELAVLVATNVVRRAINAGDYGVEEIVEQALARVSGRDSVTIFLSPADKQQLEQLQTSIEQHAFHDLNVQADASLNPGDCFADAGDVGMLTTVEQHLTDLRQWLLEGLDDGLPTTGDDNSQGDESPDSIVQRIS